MNITTLYPHWVHFVDNIDFPNIVAFRIAVNNKEHVQFLLDEIIAQKGEGIVLREMNSHYISGRSNKLFKIKVSYSENKTAN